MSARVATLPPDVVCVEDYEPLARAVMSDNAWAYISGGAGDETTVRWNREAYGHLALSGRVLADLSQAQTRVSLCGTDLDYPILLAPAAYQCLAHPDGERATVEGAGAMGALTVVSTEASVPLETLAAAATAPLWFQLYIQHDRDFTHGLVDRVARAGYRALVVTVDAPINGVRDRERRVPVTLPPGIEPVNLRGMIDPPAYWPSFVDSPLLAGPVRAAPTWRDIEWLRSISSLPILLKGIMTPADAVRAIEAGMDGVIVSNHGGRTLDTLPATIDVLAVVAEAVGNRVPVLVDGGIRRGTDVLKAIALGASAGLVGRPYVYALAVAGALGVAHVLQMLRAELEAAMVLTGCGTLEEIRSQVRLVRRATGGLRR